MPEKSYNLEVLRRKCHEEITENIDWLANFYSGIRHFKKYPQETAELFSDIGNTSRDKALLCRVAGILESQQDLDTLNWFESEVRNHKPDLSNEVSSSSWNAVFNKYLEELVENRLKQLDSMLQEFASEAESYF
jgi:hypothetical protein